MAKTIITMKSTTMSSEELESYARDLMAHGFWDKEYPLIDHIEFETEEDY